VAHPDVPLDDGTPVPSPLPSHQRGESVEEGVGGGSGLSTLPRCPVGEEAKVYDGSDCTLGTGTGLLE
jgi:hypothetical protein